MTLLAAEGRLSRFISCLIEARKRDANRQSTVRFVEMADGLSTRMAA
jgi:hypothetical protein